MKTHTHQDGPETERIAFLKVAPVVKGIKARILLLLQQQNLTPDEVSASQGLLINTVRRRFVDLWTAGQIRPTAVRRKNDGGNPCVVWTLGADPDPAVRAPKPCERCVALQARVAELEQDRGKLRDAAIKECDRLTAQVATLTAERDQARTVERHGGRAVARAAEAARAGDRVLQAGCTLLIEAAEEEGGPHA